MQQGLGHTESFPGAPVRVLRRPCDHLVYEKTTAHLWHGAHTSSDQRRLPSLCPSRKPLLECLRSSGAAGRAGQSRSIIPVNTASVVRRLAGYSPSWGSDRKRTKSVALAMVQQTRVFFTDLIVGVNPRMFQSFSGREPCQTINVTIGRSTKSFFTAEAAGFRKISTNQ
jgi:hypothetical protein